MPPGVVIIPGLQKASSLFRMFLSYLFVSNELPDPVLPYLGFCGQCLLCQLGLSIFGYSPGTAGSPSSSLILLKGP